MAGRIRSIKPEILEDDRTSSLSDTEWRVFVSLIAMADDYGNFRATPGYVHGVVFWSRPEALASDTATALERLEDVGLVEFYVVRGQSYGHIRNWEKHQRVNNAGKPRVPGKGDPEAYVSTRLYVYFIQQNYTGPIKIGRASNVDRRLKALQTSSPHPLQLLLEIEGDIENELHRKFSKFRLSGEWFQPDKELLDYIATETSRRTRGELAKEAPQTVGDVSATRDTRARIPAAGSPITDHRSPITDPEPRADARRTGDANETKIPEPPEGITPIRSMTIGRPAAEAYEASARAALGSYALPTGKFAVEDVVAAVNGHAPPGLPWRELDALIRVSVAAYIADTRENPKREAGFHPRKWLDWLNGDPSRSATLKRKPSPQRAPAPRSPPRPPDTGVSLAEAARLASAAADALDQPSRDSSDSAPQGSAA